MSDDFGRHSQECPKCEGECCWYCHYEGFVVEGINDDRLDEYYAENETEKAIDTMIREEGR